MLVARVRVLTIRKFCVTGVIGTSDVKRVKAMDTLFWSDFSSSSGATCCGGIQASSRLMSSVKSLRAYRREKPDGIHCSDSILRFTLALSGEHRCGPEFTQSMGLLWSLLGQKAEIPTIRRHPAICVPIYVQRYS